MGTGKAAMQFDKQVKVIIVGAGPIGLEIGAALKRQGVDYLQFDAGQIGQTFTWWPRNTRFFSTTERIAIAGFPIQTQDQDHITGEMYLAYLRGIVERLDLQVQTYERVCGITRNESGFQVVTAHRGQDHFYRSDVVILATGDMHRPRRLGVPGEDLPHVSHYLSDPHRYFRTDLLIVGGRNSAVEAALRCFRIGARVSISYRRAAFDSEYVKPHLLPDIEAQIKNGNMTFLHGTEVLEITPGFVELQHTETDVVEQREADFVLLCTGYEADQSLMEGIGVTLEGELRKPVHNPDTMETNIPGLYVAGTAVAGIQSRYTVFIENSHQHVGRIVHAITGSWPEELGTVPGRTYDLDFEDYKRN